MCQICSGPDQAQHGDRRDRDDVDRLDGDDDGALVDPVGGDPADQDERHQAAPRQVATSDSDAGSLSIAMT